MSLFFLQGGMLTTVQDMGRLNYRQYGISVSGVMDSRSASLANTLVGNPINEAVLEITIMGPTILFNKSVNIAITGGNISVKCNDKIVPLYEEFLVNAGETVVFGDLISGCRVYMAIGGGMDIPNLMGSYSTYLKGEIGGFKGRALKKGDTIELRTHFISNSKRKIRQDDFSSTHKKLRVILGPQKDAFTKEGIQTFEQNVYKISPQCDRMGYRLEGEKVQHLNDANIISDGITFGSIQVSGDGMPIVMMSDCQTTGGYAKIATVISVDLPILAQGKPGDTVSFEVVSIEEAQILYLDWINELEFISNNCENEQQNLKMPIIQETNDEICYNIRINDQRFICRISEIK